MRKYIILLALIVLIKADSDTCTTGYADSLLEACQALSTSSIKCTLIGINCKVKYSACSDYNPESGFDRFVCTSIIPSDIKKKYVDKTEGGKLVCQEDDKVCTDEDNDQTNCVIYKDGADQRCVYLPSTGCEAHYEECSKATSSSAANIPKDHKKNCQIEGGNCAAVGRSCEEGVRVFWDKYGGTTESYFDLETGTDNLKRFILLSDSESCQTHYKSCGSITDDQTKCENNYPSSSKDNKCEWKQKEDTSEYECTEVDRYCEDYLGFNYKESLNDNSSPKTCIQLTSSE